jgi:hypothetical protein
MSTGRTTTIFAAVLVAGCAGAGGADSREEAVSLPGGPELGEVPPAVAPADCSCGALEDRVGALEDADGARAPYWRTAADPGASAVAHCAAGDVVLSGGCTAGGRALVGYPVQDGAGFGWACGATDADVAAGVSVFALCLPL